MTERSHGTQGTKKPARPLTLTQYILDDRSCPNHGEDLSILLNAIETACKFISSQVRAAGLLDLHGVEGTTNVQGEEVKKLDVISNDAFITSLKRCKKVCIMASEENEDPILVHEASNSQYVAVFDPLDGSSNIDANVSIGTIFGIYNRVTKPSEKPGLKDLLQPGRALIAAGYAVYGSATLLVLTTGGTVNGFTLDSTVGEFVLTHPKIRIPDRGSIYSVNEGNTKHWYEPVLKYVHQIKFPDKGSAYKSRYVGSMVADVHRTLTYGGIFMYPADKSAKDGKLRLLYEANPMSLLMEIAGGTASTGTMKILDIVPDKVHQRTAVFLGSCKDMEDLERCFKVSDKAKL